jgi:ferredoxin
LFWSGAQRRQRFGGRALRDPPGKLAAGHEEGLAMKIHIDKAACVGNARCAAVAPKLFPLDENGYIQVEQIDVPPGKEDLARRGARACPERIIMIEDAKK